MRIIRVVETPVSLRASASQAPVNAVVDFSRHTVSLVAVVSDVMRGGKPVAGVAFNSIGRFAQTGILRDRMIPRLLAADPDSLLDDSGRIDPAAVLSCVIADEKPGGHGDRAGAAAALELACWDLLAKCADEPAAVTIAHRFGRERPDARVPVYAAGGYYGRSGGAGGDIAGLGAEMRRYLDCGYAAVKMKIGGATMPVDLARIEAAIDAVGGPQRLAVDANGRFDRASALRWAQALEPYNLRWYEEPGDPLDFELNAAVAEHYAGPVATGENLFSTPDVVNLVRYGGMRTDRDVFQMDAGLSYGLTEYARMIHILEGAGFDRRSAQPHGGHLINLHIVAGLGLGGCEAYPGVFAPFGGYSDDCAVHDGTISPGAAPGFGLERKDDLGALIDELLN